jgi:hypothetical protein
MQKQYPNKNIKKELDLENFLPILEIEQYSELFTQNFNIDNNIKKEDITKEYIAKKSYESFYN